jgi:uncharacterized protein YktB (UPF0637 family)
MYDQNEDGKLEMFDLGMFQDKLFKTLKLNENTKSEDEVPKLYTEIRKLIDEHMRRQIYNKRGIASKEINDEVFSVILGGESVLGLVSLIEQ